MKANPTTLDYLMAKTWLQKTGRWQDEYQAMLDPVDVYIAFTKLYYKANMNDRALWKRIQEANNDQ